VKTLIVGAGIGGMVTALYERMAGHEVLMFESKSRLGGRLAYHERGEYRVDEGPTVVLLPDMIKDILEELGLSERVEFIQIDPLYPLHYPDGSKFLKWSNKEKQKKEIEKFFPGESGGFDKYMNDMRERYNDGKASFLDHAFLQRREFWTMGNIKTLMKLKAYQSVRKQSRKYFKSTRLQEAFALQTLYIGGSPGQTPAIYSLVPFSEHEHGIWYVKGGYAKLAEVLAEALEERGVEVRTHSRVSEIVTKGTEATGCIVNGEEIEGDRIILNAEFPAAEKLMPEPPKKTYKPSSGCLLFYFGLNKPLDTDHVHNFYIGESLDNHMNDLFVNHRLSNDPAFYVFNPSLIDETLAPRGHGVAYVLVPVPAADKVSRQEYITYAGKIRELLIERTDADLNEKIEWEHIRTPYEAELDGLYQGGSFGIAPTLFQSGVFRPQVKPFSYSNVYAVGASVHPGGGIPIVMHGAKVLSEILRSETKEELMDIKEN
jgi:phytoene desaturase